jgi:two-component system, LuxR family, response regulator FixJ
MEPTVFIVDDDEAVRDSLAFLLEMHGWPVRQFGSGGDLLDDLPLAPSGCFIVDYHMSAINGLDLLAALRKRNIALPAILISGLANSRMRQRAAEAGVLTLLEKPFADDALVAAVTRALADPASSPLRGRHSAG